MTSCTRQCQCRKRERKRKARVAPPIGQLVGQAVPRDFSPFETPLLHHPSSRREVLDADLGPVDGGREDLCERRAACLRGGEARCDDGCGRVVVLADVRARLAGGGNLLSQPRRVPEFLLDGQQRDGVVGRGVERCRRVRLVDDERWLPSPAPICRLERRLEAITLRSGSDLDTDRRGCRHRDVAADGRHDTFDHSGALRCTQTGGVDREPASEGRGGWRDCRPPTRVPWSRSP